MLRLKYYDTLGNPHDVEAARVLVCTNEGTELFVAMEWQPDVYHYASRDDKEFDQLMNTMGIRRTTIEVRQITPPTIQAGVLDITDEVR